MEVERCAAYLFQGRRGGRSAESSFVALRDAMLAGGACDGGVTGGYLRSKGDVASWG